MPKTIDIHPDDDTPEARVMRVLNVIDALPADFGRVPNDDTPLRDVLPGGWPTLGDLRGLGAFLKRIKRF